jgi:hypothetical protein
MPSHSLKKDPIVVLRNKINKAKDDKQNLLLQWDYNISSMQEDHYLYQKSKNVSYKKGYASFQKLLYLNRIINKLSKELEEKFNIVLE